MRISVNKQKFFDKNFYPVSLFYLGMTTLKNTYRMTLSMTATVNQSER